MGYTLSDSSRTNIGALVSDAAVEDTQDIQRATFRVSPSAERLPYPPTSHPWIPVGLRVVTVLCLFIGLIGISFGLIERAAPGTTATWFVHRNVADPGGPQSKSWFDQPGDLTLGSVEPDGARLWGVRDRSYLPAGPHRPLLDAVERSI